MGLKGFRVRCLCGFGLGGFGGFGAYKVLGIQV